MHIVFVTRYSLAMYMLILVWVIFGHVAAKYLVNAAI